MNAIKHILVPTDFGQCANHALDAAVSLATRFNAKLTLAHVCEIPISAYAMYAQGLVFPAENLEGEAQKALDSATEELKKRYPNSDSVMRSGATVEELIAIRDEIGADLIVMGTHGRHGVSRMLLGSMAEEVIRMSGVPVLTIPSQELEDATHALDARKSA